MELDAAPAVAAIANAEQGIVDSVGEKSAAWSPMNAYFVQLEPQILGTVAPANRQFAARWARKKHTLGGAFLSSYLRAAATTLESGTEFALAMDLEDVVNPRRALARIKAGEFPSLVGNEELDANAIAKLAATLKGITIRVDIAEEAAAKCSVDFGEDASALTAVGKALFLDVLARVGAKLDDAEGWTASVKRNSLVLEGKLSSAGLRQLFSLIEPPAPALVRASRSTSPPHPPEPPAAAGGTPPPPAAAAEVPKVKASQEYFKTVDGILDRLAKSMGTGAKNVGLAEGATWMQRDARRISRLPIVGVDPELVRWAADVSTRLRDASQPLVSGRLQGGAQTAGIVGSFSYNEYDSSNDNEMARVEGERRRAALEQRATSVEAAAGIVRELLISRDQVRIAMVEKYKVEF